jgi:carboxyl-terminal processing protease
MGRTSFFLLLPLLALGAVASASGEQAWRNKSAQPMESQDFSSWRNKPNEPFTKSVEVFQLVKQELLKNYFDKGLKEEDLYRAAAKAGISAGDQILRVNDKSYKGKQLRDVIYAIRGQANSDVKLTILHDEQIKEIKFKREALVWDTVKTRMLPGEVGLVMIRNFTEATPNALKNAISKLNGQGVKGLILDLRFNEGGIFEAATESIRVFVPKGKPIVKMKKRDGPEEVIAGTSDPLFKAPIVVLINNHTKSGGEVMAAALKMSGGATTVGDPTYGKWSAQRVDELPNGFAIKYTIATFRPPSGEDLSGRGLQPDIYVSTDAEAIQKSQSLTDTNAMIQADLQLASALNILKLKK